MALVIGGYSSHMPSISFVIGPSRSGKTTTVLQHAAQLYQEDPFSEVLILVPTVRHADQIRRRLVQLCGVAFQLRVETIRQFSGSIVDSSVTVNADVANELLKRITHEAVKSGHAAYFAPIARTDGFHRSLSSAATELLQNDVDAEAFGEAAQATGDVQLQGLAALYRSYRRGLDEHQWRHPAELPSIAAAALATGTGVARLVLIDGFEAIREGELRLIKALAAKADVYITLDPDAGDRSSYAYASLNRRFPGALLVLTGKQSSPSLSVFAAEAIDREAELRGIARQIKQLLTDDPALRPSDCAITFRQVGPYLGLARQVFLEYDLPLDPAAGVKLRSRPLGVWLRRLIQLPRNDWRISDLSAVLSSGLVNQDRWGVGREELSLFVRRARRVGLWAGLESLAMNIDGLRTDAQNSEASPAMLQSADGVEKALVDLQALLNGATGAPSTHAAAIDQILFGQSPMVGTGARNTPGASAEMEALRGHLRSIGQTEEAFGLPTMSRGAFLALLEAKLEAPVIVLREAGGVLLAPMHTLHGLRFKHVLIGGLVEGEFPAPRASTTLLGQRARELLAASGLTLSPESRSSEDQLWASDQIRADGSLTLWRSRLNERGRPVTSSYYYTAIDAATLTIDVPTALTAASRRELAIACTQQWANGSTVRPPLPPSWNTVRTAVLVEQRRRSFGNAGAFEGAIDHGLVPQITSANAVWSASRLESYLTCGFQFFGGYGLKLHGIKQEMIDADAATRGIVIHEILQSALEPLIQAGDPLSSRTVEGAVAHLRASGPAIWQRAPQQYGFGHAGLWNLDMNVSFDQLEALLRREAEASDNLAITKVLGAETTFEGSIALEPPMRVMGIVDRIDQGESLTVVVDYKSGRPIERRELEAGKRIQLQLYSYLASMRTGASRMIARYAWVRPPKKEWDLDSAKPEDASLIQAVVGTAAAVRTNVERGNFQVAPSVQPCPSYCAMIHVCRVNEYTRWKSWS